jgi:outer membrane receptor protein involved in Fe transport
MRANLYVLGNHLTLWNDFTHFLVDPVNGDQEAQHESRTAIGGQVSYERSVPLFGIENDLLVGGGTRNDSNQVSRYPTIGRRVIPPSADALNFTENDSIRLSSVSVFAQATTHWTDWFRTVAGYRYDTQYGSDSGTNSGTASGHLLAPKGSLIFRPIEPTEIYFSAGRNFHSDDLRGVTAAQNAHLNAAPLIARQSGMELGLRQEFTHAFTMTVALYDLRAESETTYDPDAGVDGAGPASRRRGFEVNLTYQAFEWLEFYGSYSANHSRFTETYDDGTGHTGFFMPNSPSATGSFNIYLKNLGAWNGSLGYRYLSGYPLSADDAVKGHGYGEWSGDVHYELGRGWSVGLGIYNILAKRADAAEFWYIDRLPGEPAEGVADVHIHPLEGRTGRLTIEKKFTGI